MQKKLKIKNKRNLLLSVIVDTPSESEKFPTVLMLHGFRGYKEEENYSELASELLEHNIASVRFDASGFGESEGSLEKDYRFSNYIDDTESVYSWMLNQDFVDKQRIGVMGASMGGAQTLLFASNHPQIKVACAVSPPDRVGTDDALGKVRNQWRKDGFIEEMSSRYGKKIRIPHEYLEDAEKYDFTEYTKKIKSPILIILGNQDETVLPNQTRKVFEAANQPKKLLEFENMNHFYKRDKKILAKVNREIIKFIKEHI